MCKEHVGLRFLAHLLFRPFPVNSPGVPSIDPETIRHVLLMTGLATLVAVRDLLEDTG